MIWLYIYIWLYIDQWSNLHRHQSRSRSSRPRELVTTTAPGSMWTSALSSCAPPRFAEPAPWRAPSFPAVASLRRLKEVWWSHGEIGGSTRFNPSENYENMSFIPLKIKNSWNHQPERDCSSGHRPLETAWIDPPFCLSRGPINIHYQPNTDRQQSRPQQFSTCSSFKRVVHSGFWSLKSS